MACGIRECALLEQVVINFQHIHQLAPHCVTLSLYATAANCSPGVLEVTTCWVLLPLVGGIKAWAE